MADRFTHGYALIVGVGESADPKWSLPVAVKDVQVLQSILADGNLCACPGDDAHIRLLHDAGATQGGILGGLAWRGAPPNRLPRFNMKVVPHLR